MTCTYTECLEKLVRNVATDQEKAAKDVRSELAFLVTNSFDSRAFLPFSRQQHECHITVDAYLLVQAEMKAGESCSKAGNPFVARAQQLLAERAFC